MHGPLKLELVFLVTDAAKESALSTRSWFWGNCGGRRSYTSAPVVTHVIAWVFLYTVAQPPCFVWFSTRIFVHLEYLPLPCYFIVADNVFFWEHPFEWSVYFIVADNVFLWEHPFEWLVCFVLGEASNRRNINLINKFFSLFGCLMSSRFSADKKGGFWFWISFQIR